MSTLPQATEVLSTHLNEPLPRTKQISQLLDAELLPKSAGKRIEQLGANEIAIYLIALSTAKRPADVAARLLHLGARRSRTASRVRPY